VSVIEKDFDRLALLDRDGWTANNQYHQLLQSKIPAPCHYALEVGCGTGAFSRRLARHADHVLALDLSAEMIRAARARSTHIPNLDFEVGDVMARDLPLDHFDCIVTIATLHHLPLREALLKFKEALNPGGVLIVLDLCDSEHNLLTLAGWREAFLNLAAIGMSCTLRLLHNGRLRPPREVRAAWADHGTHDSYPTMPEVWALTRDLFPGAQVQRHLLWRYSLAWTK
jgi:SAM-dependent methyltransferase